MGGAASVVATMRAIAALQLPINVVAATPLVENMPSGTATKPGDVICAMNGLTVEVDNTDAEVSAGWSLRHLCQVTGQAKVFSPLFTVTGSPDPF